MTLPELLEIRLKAVLESPTEQRFYQNVHAYINLIIKDEKGGSIMESSEHAYSLGHYTVWQHYTNDDDIVDERARQTYKLERFNLYADKFVTLYVRIYLPIEDFINSPEPINRQDPVALIALYGHKSRLLDEWALHSEHRSMPPKEARKSIAVYYKWFVGMRDEYTADLKQFHVDFITAYESERGEVEEIVTPAFKPPIVLNPRTGDFTFFNVTDTLNPKGNEYKVLYTLLYSKDYYAEYPELIGSYRNYNPELLKATLKPELAQIIKTLKRKLGILQTERPNPDIFENIKGVGYRLINPASITNP